MDKQFRNDFNSTIKWRRVDQRSATSDLVHEDPGIQLKCLYDVERKVVRDEEGEERVSEGTLYFDGADLDPYYDSVSTEDVIEFVNGTLAQILRIKPYWKTEEHLEMVEVNLS